MDSHEMLREAISEAVDEVLTDELDPQKEADRLGNVVVSMFWQAYNERTLYGQQNTEYTRRELDGYDSARPLYMTGWTQDDDERHGSDIELDYFEQE